MENKGYILYSIVRIHYKNDIYEYMEHIGR